VGSSLKKFKNQPITKRAGSIGNSFYLIKLKKIITWSMQQFCRIHLFIHPSAYIFFDRNITFFAISYLIIIMGEFFITWLNNKKIIKLMSLD
jgi:hypothetical protein